MLSVPKTILFALLATVAVVGVLAGFDYYRNRPVPPPPLQTVKSLHELGILPKGYDGWMAHVEVEE